MSRPRPGATTLLRKAEGDLLATSLLGQSSDVSIWMVGFHAQQAVEKSLKAVLAHRDVSYPFTHDLETLTLLLKNTQSPLPPDYENLSRLTPFGTFFRYEDEELDLPVSVSLDRMLGWANSTVSWAHSIVSGNAVMDND